MEKKYIENLGSNIDDMGSESGVNDPFLSNDVRNDTVKEEVYFQNSVSESSSNHSKTVISTCCSDKNLYYPGNTDAFRQANIGNHTNSNQNIINSNASKIENRLPKMESIVPSHISGAPHQHIANIPMNRTNLQHNYSSEGVFPQQPYLPSYMTDPIQNNTYMNNSDAEFFNNHNQNETVYSQFESQNNIFTSQLRDSTMGIKMGYDMNNISHLNRMHMNPNYDQFKEYNSGMPIGTKLGYERKLDNRNLTASVGSDTYKFSGMHHAGVSYGPSNTNMCMKPNMHVSGSNPMNVNISPSISQKIGQMISSGHTSISKKSDTNNKPRLINNDGGSTKSKPMNSVPPISLISGVLNKKCNEKEKISHLPGNVNCKAGLKNDLNSKNISASSSKNIEAMKFRVPSHNTSNVAAQFMGNPNVANNNLAFIKKCNNNMIGSINVDLDIDFHGNQKRKRKRLFAGSNGELLREDVNAESKYYKHYTDNVLKELLKNYRNRNQHKVVVATIKRKIIIGIQKEHKKKTLKSLKLEKAYCERAKRVFKEVMNKGKKHIKPRSNAKKSSEKELIEKRKLEEKYREMKRQQRKLNYLITQTELFSHFMELKVNNSEFSVDKNSEELNKILSKLDEQRTELESMSDNVDFNDITDTYNPEETKDKAVEITKSAAEKQCHNIDMFRTACDPDFNDSLNQQLTVEEYFESKNKSFCGDLKSYQVEGVSWLVGLFDKGINGILADEMGLGKTVQTMGFLAYLAETYNTWGPFLVVAPASTLHNWQQELSKFVPSFKVISYWGNSNERKSLRTLFNTKKSHLFFSKDTAPFNVLVTNYQLVIRDFQYFKNMNWQYIVLDEAQAIKSSNSQRWKTLLSFKCRNRLLLTGTPIQNTMAELWALLHFIMPTLFDSHDEFSEWFSKDIEGKVESKTSVDQLQLSRLHMILKPFMLRRTKDEVASELSKKIEIQLNCELTMRQRSIYDALMRKLTLHNSLDSENGFMIKSEGVPNNINQLMNLVVQFRKACNHPDLFERRDIISPYIPPKINLFLPKCFFNEFIFDTTIKSCFNIYCPNQIASQWLKDYNDFSFLNLFGAHPGLLNRFIHDSYKEIQHYLEELDKNVVLLHKELFESKNADSSCLLKLWPRFKLSAVYLANEYFRTFQRITFISSIRNFSGHGYSSVYELKEGKLVMEKFHTKKLYRNENDVPVNSELISEVSDFEGSVMCDENMSHNVNETPATNDSTETQDKNRFNSENDFESNIIKMTISNIKTVKGNEKIISEPHKYPNFLTSAYDNKVLVPKFYPEFLLKRAYILNQIKNIENDFYDEIVTDGVLPDAVNNKYYWSAKRPTGFNSYENFSYCPFIRKPDSYKIISDSGKMCVLHLLLRKLKSEGHRVLIYSQMTRMIDILEDYMTAFRYKYVRLDGSSKICDRKDTVADFQSNDEIFIFLLSTRAGGIGINLTGADTVIFYDSDWNPTVDQQAMDRVHRLGQTKQVTVYRLICEGTVEERILQRANEKSMIQKMIIKGKKSQEHLKTKDVLRFLLDDNDLKKRVDSMNEIDKKRKRKAAIDENIVSSSCEAIAPKDSNKQQL